MTSENRKRTAAARRSTGRYGDGSGVPGGVAPALPGTRAPDSQVAPEILPPGATPPQLSIVRRLGDWRTLASFAIALAVLLLAVAKAGINWSAARETLARANLWLFALAFMVYYASFPLRAYRWRLLLRNANSGPARQGIDRVSLWDLTQIVYLSYFANAVVPAKLGDVYRAYLARRLHDVYAHFRHGAVNSFGYDVPLLVGQTVVIWLLEGARFACVLAALGLLSLDGKGVGLAAALFLALGSSVLTTLPLTPAGLGLVEPFIVAVLALLRVPGGVTTAVAVALLERIVSYLSIAVLGFIVYLVSDKARLAPPADAAPVASARTA